MTMEANIHPASIVDWVVLLVMGVGWFAATVFILCIMEVC